MCKYCVKNSWKNASMIRQRTSSPMREREWCVPWDDYIDEIEYKFFEQEVETQLMSKYTLRGGEKPGVNAKRQSRGILSGQILLSDLSDIIVEFNTVLESFIKKYDRAVQRQKRIQRIRRHLGLLNNYEEWEKPPEPEPELEPENDCEV